MPEDEDEFRRWYGEWATVRPADVPALLEGFDGPWWIAGGYAIEAFTGVERRHEDVDVSLFRRDADLLRAAIGREGTLWSAFLASLRPFSDDVPEVHPDASQLWLRRDAGSPWLLDLLLNPDRDGRWVNRRHPEMDLSLEEVTWTRTACATWCPRWPCCSRPASTGPRTGPTSTPHCPCWTPASAGGCASGWASSTPATPGSTTLTRVPASTDGHREVMSDDTSITVSRTIDASTQDVFDVLSNPQRHAELDGSGFVLGDEKSDRITATGQVFRMNMSGPHMGGEYQTDNTVTGYDANHLLAWQTAPADNEPPGWEWVWRLQAQGSDATEVTLTYDWSKVTDQQVLQQVGFPLVQQSQLETSLDHLAAAVAG